MGTYLNPGNSGFLKIIGKNYVDKTGMIGIINRCIGTTDDLICISRPRRFGKSYAAQMLCAYYDKTCDSRSLFDGYSISNDKTYEEHLNRYDVIYLDMANIIGKVAPEKLIAYIKERIIEEIHKEYSEAAAEGSLDDVLIQIAEYTNNKFIMIIDEWDAPIRETPEIESEYLMFLRMLFKSSGTTARMFSAVYMTGILPIKKGTTQSALSDFREYTMLEPGSFAEYVGFTEDEVRRESDKLCGKFANIKKWYDGYVAGQERSVYNPYSVMQALSTGKYKSYWKNTSAAETLMTYIDMDQDGLQDDIARLIAGESIVVDTGSFENDVKTFTCKDDVLTLLIHLGYLTYEEVPDSYDEEDEQLTGFAWIPNEEVRSEFEKILRKSKHKDLVELVQRSDQLLKYTLEGNADAVAKCIQNVHESEYAPSYYNNEQSLRYVVKMAYISCVDQYAKIEELPSGHGLADLVFIPNRRSPLPALIIELKWNKTSEGAIQQIRDKNYPKVLENYGGDVILVGINYDEESKLHTCTIERIAF